MTDELIKRLRHADAPYAKPTALEILTDEAADLIEQQAAKIADLATDLERTRNQRNAAHVTARREIHKEHRDYIAKLEAQLATVALAVDAQPVACLICNSTGNATPCAYPTEINRQQAARIERLRKEDLSLRALYEDACIQANKNAQDAERYRWLKERYTGFYFDWMADDDGKNGKQVICFSMDYGMRIGMDIDAAIDVALSQHTGEKDD